MVSISTAFFKFTEVNPDKGTETSKDLLLICFFSLLFTEVNPDKGTETMTMRAE